MDKKTDALSPPTMPDADESTAANYGIQYDAYSFDAVERLNDEWAAYADAVKEEARNAVAELVAAAVNARYSLAWHKKQGHFVGMDGKFFDDLESALARFGGGK